jgi:hypothetical protein
LLFLPLAFASTIWPSARGWTRYLVKLLFVAIVSKFVIASVLVLGVAAFNSNIRDTCSLGDSGVESMLIGAGLLVVAFGSPFALLRFLPMAEGMLAGWSGHARAGGVERGDGRRLAVADALPRRGPQEPPAGSATSAAAGTADADRFLHAAEDGPGASSDARPGEAEMAAAAVGSVRRHSLGCPEAVERAAAMADVAAGSAAALGLVR